MENEDDYEDAQICKVVLLGESGVGKTSIISRFINNFFSENVISTTGASYAGKTMIFDEFGGKKIRFEIWDTAGQEQYRSLGKHFYKDSFIVILVYNITSKETFENLKNIWLDDVINFGEEYKVLAVVGNKCDLYEQEAVPEEEARKFAEENNAIFMNVSAKNGDNIDLLFETCVKKFFDPELHVNIRKIKDKNDDSLVIKNKHKKGKKEKEKEKKSCC